MYFEASSSCMERRAWVDLRALCRMVGILDGLSAGTGSSFGRAGFGGVKKFPADTERSGSSACSGDDFGRLEMDVEAEARGREVRFFMLLFLLRLRLELLISCRTPHSSALASTDDAGGSRGEENAGSGDESSLGL